ncbi:PorT family protein [Cognataquiflexum rubidum]|uniref:PorT family protein n=1 Tax=Cognataquiflexum rubidum TaxID=2922273 RepID=UPI001F14488A|nr:PorT family protein [Cognataquiflexum rubidum]MCH6235124.1 PorT family protein [Cognataquiflexum rubidum]
MKTSLCIVLVMFFASVTANSQDIIYKRNLEEIKVSIVEIDSLILKYKIYDFAESPVFTIKKAEVAKVMFENGSVMYFESATKPIPVAVDTAAILAQKLVVDPIPVDKSIEDSEEEPDKAKEKRRASGGGFGVKGGLNYNSNGDYFNDAQVVFGDPMKNLGFHAGFFGKIKFGPFYLRPELVYSQLKTELDNEVFVTRRIDVPVLLGFGIFRQFVSVFAGPSFHYRLDDDLNNISISDVTNNFNVGYQMGFAVNIGKVGMDLRYERELVGKEFDFNQVVTGAGEFNFQQLILGVYFKF